MLNDRIAGLKEHGIPPTANQDIKVVDDFWWFVVSSMDLCNACRPSFWRFRASVMALQGGSTGGVIK